MDGLNQVTLIGSVGKDAETKFIGEGSQKATFSLATNRSYKDKAGVKQTQTEWHNIEVWAETAKFAGQYVKKGQLVLILGEIRYEKFENKEGVSQQRTKIVASKIQLFPKGGATNGASAEKGEVADASKQTEEYAAAQATSESFAAGADDDLPF
jgi:single-strand DNA-binding protein